MANKQKNNAESDYISKGGPVIDKTAQDSALEYKSPLSFMSKHSQSSPLNIKFRRHKGDKFDKIRRGVKDADTRDMPLDNHMGNVTKK